jgi:hypothetical protein
MHFFVMFFSFVTLFSASLHAFEAEECKPISEKSCVDYSERIIAVLP